MDRERFVKLAALAFGLVLLSFLIRGTTRLVVGYETAVLLSAPVLFAAAALLAGLFVRGLLDLVGVWPLEE
ncbi:hypothetical protein [Haloparvum sedimenti]|uniref:hypothetical protein n=1 Tax=Haloparvum sedimenti TaxID=1678448 RepID=UPI00071E9687|nr:hypothetical protein [Haloparvum sedimenti]